MKRYVGLTVAALVLLGVAGTSLAVANGGSGTTVIVKPSDMKEGETKTFTDDGRTVTIRRDGDATSIKIEGAGNTRTITVTSNGGDVTIDRDGSRFRGRTLVVGPDRQRIIIDGKPLEDFHVPQFRSMPGKASTWFVCPKDHTTLRVPDGKEDQTYKCPVDGTTMEKRKGRGFAYFFDNDTFSSDL